MNEIFLTVVIPAYNEAARLPESLAGLQAYLERVAWPTEIIVVDDGSTDGTAAVVDTWTQRLPGLRLVQRPHQGKGGAVRAGILAATGEYVAIADADFSMPIEQFDRFHADVVGPYDLAIGSREAAGAKRFHEPLYRHLMGRVFNGLVRALLLPGIQDTQCGFKWIRRAIAVDLSQHQTIYGWGFDVELLYIARQRDYTIREIPIFWYYMPGSRINPLRDTFTMLRDVLLIRWNSLQGRYRPSSPLPDQVTANGRKQVKAAVPKR